MTGRLFTSDDIDAAVERECDLCIIGSGAGGAVLAATLADRGLDIVMLEAGPYKNRDDFTLRETDAFIDLYQERGLRSTDDLAIAILQGRSVGGTTTVNWTTCFRTPERILAHWQRVHGLEDLHSEALEPHFRAVEERLGIHEWPLAAANANNQKLITGLSAFGWEARPLRRNVRGCANSGYCGLGCPVDAKQAMHVTYLPDAVANGMTLFANTHVERLELAGDRIRAVHGVVRPDRDPHAAGHRVTIRPKVTVVAGGAINSPMLLLRSGIEAQGRVGRRTFLHPVVAMTSWFEERIDGFHGAPQSVGSHEFVDRGPDRVGFFLEVAPSYPVLSAVGYDSIGSELGARMADLAHIHIAVALQVDGILPGDEGGTVRLRSDGRPSIAYPVKSPLIESIRASHQILARLGLASGSTRLATLHRTPVELSSEADLPQLERAAYGAHEHSMFSAHQMGGCTMSATPDRGVVDTEHRVWGVPNLFVVDGSVMPTSLGVNPSQTVYGLARRAAKFVGEAV